MKFFFPYLLVVFFGCNRKIDSIINLNGEAQGTTYSISYFSGEGVNYKKSIDSILRKIDSSLSTYLPASLISGINRNDSNIIPDAHFTNVFEKAAEVAEKTNGAFDITVAPVINAWGFGFTKKAPVDSIMIDSLLQYVGYRKAKMINNHIVKENSGVMLDFNAIAQGYTVDVLSSFLEGKGISSYFVELGGEVKTKGKKINGDYWKVGIDKPDETSSGERVLEAIIELEDKALATSGNYRKFYVENGNKYAHIIDPHTGFPARHNLLSATVIANDCMTADAYATAFMVMGVEKAKDFLSLNNDLSLDVYFIYDDQGKWKTYISDGLKKRIREMN